MFKYTRSAISESFDFVKNLIFSFQIVVQLIYIGYVSYRLIYNLGYLAFNIILLVVSVFYVIFYILTKREFYSNKLILQKNVIRWVVKVIKYIIHIFIISIATKELISGKVDNENVAILVLVLMIFGFFFSILFDIILGLIDRQITLIESAVLYDIEVFKVERTILTKIIKQAGLDLEKEYPKFTDEKSIKKVKEAFYKQDMKKIRKRDFRAKNPK